jgi:hypothetical protein
MSAGEGPTQEPTEHADFQEDPRVVSDLVIDSYKPLQVRSWFRFLYSPRRRLKRELEAAIGKASENEIQAMLSLIADCDLRAYDSERLSKRWASAYYVFGLPAAVLATIAGAAGLASTAGRIPAAIIALVSAGLTTAATFLNSNKNRQNNIELSAAWQELADDARLAVIRDRNSTEKTPLYGENSLVGDLIVFNRRKSALRRGDLTPPAEKT